MQENDQERQMLTFSFVPYMNQIHFKLDLDNEETLEKNFSLSYSYAMRNFVIFEDFQKFFIF